MTCAESLSRVWLFATHGLWPARFLCPWDFPGKNAGVGCHFLLQGIFLTQESIPHIMSLLHWQADSLPLHHLGRPWEKDAAYFTHTCTHPRNTPELPRNLEHHKHFHILSIYLSESLCSDDSHDEWIGGFKSLCQGSGVMSNHPHLPEACPWTQVHGHNGAGLCQLSTKLWSVNISYHLFPVTAGQHFFFGSATQLVGF